MFLRASELNLGQVLTKDFRFLDPSTGTGNQIWSPGDCMSDPRPCGFVCVLRSRVLLLYPFGAFISFLFGAFLRSFHVCVLLHFHVLGGKVFDCLFPGNERFVSELQISESAKGYPVKSSLCPVSASGPCALVKPFVSLDF